MNQRPIRTTFEQKPRVLVPALPIGNLAAIANMVRKAGGEPIVTADPTELLLADRIILAGVGAFDAGMRSLMAGGWLPILHEVANAGRTPILGICLGMQLMCRRSEEGKLSGLGWFAADVKRIVATPYSNLKVPHMGWNALSVKQSAGVFSGAEAEQRFYFVHSYQVVCDNLSDIVATTMYAGEMTAVIGRAKLLGVQFHPEKSHRFGLNLVQRFIANSP